MKTGQLVYACLAVASFAPRLVAQGPAQTEVLATLIMAEDRREFNVATLSRGLTDPDPMVRRTAATSVGRIGDRRGTRLLLPLLADADSAVVTSTMFALGLMRDSSAVDPIIARMRAPEGMSADAATEAATALARIGGAAAARYIESVLSGTADLPQVRRNPFILGALQDAWKLGALMPAAAMLRYTGDASIDLRSRAIYSLGRILSPIAGRALLAATRDQTAMIRETAAKYLVKRFADTASLAVPAVIDALVSALDDDLAGVRVNALGSLATFADSNTAKRIIPLLTDGDLNVRVAAATALGSVKGSAAIAALNVMMDRKDATWALRRAGLAALVRIDTASFTKRAPAWIASGDFRDRVAALQGWGSVVPARTAVFRSALADPDVRVQAAALDAWRAARGDTGLQAAARARLRSPDPGVRGAALAAIRSSMTDADIDLLVTAWKQSLADRESDSRIAVLNSFRALLRTVPGLLRMLDEPARRSVLERPEDPVVRASAATIWPELAQRWGDKWPINTGKSIDDYRSLVRLYLLAPVNPRVTIDVDGRGTIEIELLAHDAPLTVANFLRLVDQHYFDGNRWHRVVPNFVIQDGDKTGTGNGGPGWAIRDEINRERYTVPVLGMALSGADTGGSQWFINLSTQPHLDGQYTIFGKVVGSYNGLHRVVQGDLIRSIRR